MTADPCCAAALEGVAFSIRDALDALLGNDRPPHLRLAGGGTLAAGWRQLLANVLELPLYAVDVPAASGRGAALLGARAAGLLSFDEIQGPLAPRAGLVAEPDPAMSARYAERHARFRRIVAALGPAARPAQPPTGQPDTGKDSMTIVTEQTLTRLSAACPCPVRIAGREPLTRLTTKQGPLNNARQTKLAATCSRLNVAAVPVIRCG